MMSAKYMALALAVLLPGCTMAPNYVRPEAPVAEAWPDDLMPKGTVLAQATDQLASEIGSPISTCSGSFSLLWTTTGICASPR